MAFVGRLEGRSGLDLGEVDRGARCDFLDHVPDEILSSFDTRDDGGDRPAQFSLIIALEPFIGAQPHFQEAAQPPQIRDVPAELSDVRHIDTGDG